MEKLVKLIFYLSAVYFTVFSSIGYLSQFHLLEVLVPNRHITNILICVFNGGYILLWVYIILVLLDMLGIIKIRASRIIIMMFLISTTLGLFFINYLGQRI